MASRQGRQETKGPNCLLGHVRIVHPPQCQARAVTLGSRAVEQPSGCRADKKQPHSVRWDGDGS